MRSAKTGWVASLGIPLLLQLAACSEHSYPTRGPTFMMDYELIGCDPTKIADCRPIELNPRQLRIVQDLLPLIQCPPNRTWLENNLSLLRVYDVDDGNYGDYHTTTGNVDLSSGLFSNPTELVKTLVHESNHAVYPLLGEGGARWAEDTCVSGG